MNIMRKLFLLSLVFISLLVSSLSWGSNGESAEKAPINSIKSMTVNRAGGNILLRIGLRQPLATPPAHFSIANPARLVFDLPDTGNGLGYSSKTINEGGLRSLNIVQSGDRSRLVLNLDKLIRFETRQEEQALIVSLVETDASTARDDVPLQKFEGVIRQEAQSIRDIQFRRSKDGAGVVVVDLSAPDTGIDIHQRGKGLFVSFKKTSLPETLRRKIDVVDFSTPITAVKTTVVGEDVNMEITPKGLWEHVAFQTDNQFVVEVRPIQADPDKLFQGTKSGYQGEVISLSFQNIPVRELLHVFADITNFNIVVSDTVSGNVSLRLNDVAWDHALEIVLQQKNLAMRKSGNVLWIAPRDELAARDKLEVEAREAAVAAEMPRMEAFQLSYQKAENFLAMISAGEKKADKDTQTSSSDSFLSSVGRVSLDKRSNQLFIYDVPSKLEVIRGLLAKIDRPARQVLIEARIVEADTSFSKALGARLGGNDHRGLTQGHNILGTDMRYGIAATTVDTYSQIQYRDYVPAAYITKPPEGNTPGTFERIVQPPDEKKGAVIGTLSNTQFSNNPITNPLGQFALSLFNSAKSQILTLELTARETDGLSKSVASPRVLTADQAEATIEAGTKIPYESKTSSGSTYTEYLKATLLLKVTPQITPDGKVIMKLNIKKDAPGEYKEKQGYTVSAKEINSDVMVENGGTVVIGGIFEEVEKSASGRVPFLGDLPYIGFLFKQKTTESRKTELIIMITPRIVDDSLAVKL